MCVWCLNMRASSRTFAGEPVRASIWSGHVSHSLTSKKK